MAIAELEPLINQKLLLSRDGSLFHSNRFTDTKDPCPVYDGKGWHIYGSAGDSITQQWQILHATAPSIDGPWTEQEPAMLDMVGPHVAAPGVIYDPREKLLHMFVQTDCFGLGGTIEHLTSSDGTKFNSAETALVSLPGTDEAGLYDSHPSLIGGQRYLVYSGMPQVGHGDIYLASSLSDCWNGFWERQGKILAHEQVEYHNQHDHPDYEWGLEGPQLVELPNGKVLLNAVCFLPYGTRGTRQRVFFAVAERVMGPYQSLGTVLEPNGNLWESGENGSATGLIMGNSFQLFYQARPVNGSWRYGRAVFDTSFLT